MKSIYDEGMSRAPRHLPSALVKRQVRRLVVQNLWRAVSWVRIPRAFVRWFVGSLGGGSAT